MNIKTLLTCHNVPELGLNQADGDNIGPVLAHYGMITRAFYVYFFMLFFYLCFYFLIGALLGSGGRCQEGETMVLQAEQEINEVDSNHTIINHVEKNNEANFVAVDGNATPVIMEASREDQELVTVDGGETSIIIDTGDQSILSQTSVIIDDHRELCEVVQVWVWAINSLWPSDAIWN